MAISVKTVTFLATKEELIDLNGYYYKLDKGMEISEERLSQIIATLKTHHQTIIEDIRHGSDDVLIIRRVSISKEQMDKITRHLLRELSGSKKTEALYRRTLP